VQKATIHSSVMIIWHYLRCLKYIWGIFFFRQPFDKKILFLFLSPCTFSHSDIIYSHHINHTNVQVPPNSITILNQANVSIQLHIIRIEQHRHTLKDRHKIIYKQQKQQHQTLHKLLLIHAYQFSLSAFGPSNTTKTMNLI
jgi:hypothetical protein